MNADKQLRQRPPVSGTALLAQLFLLEDLEQLRHRLRTQRQQHGLAVDVYSLSGYSGQVITAVVLSDKVRKGLKKLPQHVVDKLLDWVSSVEELGLAEIRKLPGYHDEPLKGDRKGQRSIRLSLAYRAFYVLKKDKIEVEYVEVLEVNKHRY